MATIALYNVKQQKLVDYEVGIDLNREIVATYKDSDGTEDVIKFPGGITKNQLLSLVEQHNIANQDQVPVDEKALAKLDKKNEDLLASLE